MKRAALFVGVNNYQAPLRPLSCAREDAAALYQFFLKDYSPDLVHFLPDPDSDAIIDKVKFITANLDSGDLFLIYFSGHGVEARNEHLLLSARAENLAGEWRHAVSINLLKELTKKSGVQTVFIIDSCREQVYEGAKNVPAAVQARSVTMKRLIDSTDPDFLPPVIFCSCSSGQMAFEVKELQHGIFTLALLDTLKDCSCATLDDVTHSVAAGIQSLLSVYHPGGQQTPEIMKAPLVNPVMWGTPRAKVAVPPPPPPLTPHVQPGIGAGENQKNCCTLSPDGTILLKCKADYNGICYIPAGVVTIAENAFSGCAGVTGLVIPETVKEIGDCAFSGCCNLSSLTLPSSVVAIGACAFNECRNLTFVTFRDGLESIGVRAFEGCSSLSRVTIPGSVTAIGSNAFSSCGKLIDVTIPERFYSQLDSILGPCEQLQSVNGKTVGRGPFGKLRIGC